MASPMKEDKRFKQCTKEVWFTVVFFIFNVLLVFGLTFPLGNNVEASEIKLVAGFPEWYFYGVIISTVVLVIATFLMVHFLYKDMPLDDYVEESEQ